MPNAARLPYMPQLDSLRAIAILAVFVEHFISPGDPFRDVLPWGWLGVRMFFVLSGFLITDILLSLREKVEARKTATGRLLRGFYIRRFLRLSPAYYLYLLFAAVFLPLSRPYLVFFALYVQNFLFAVKPQVFSRFMAHFWTLAIEEQFYLIWPWIIVFVPRRLLVKTITVFVLAGLLFRGAALLLGVTPFQVGMWMPAHFDTLGFGGLLAVLRLERRSGLSLPKLGMWLGAPLLFAYVVSLHFYPADNWMLTVFGESAAGLFFVWFISRAAHGFDGVLGWLLNQKALISLGLISYGMYVYHFNVPGIIRDKLLPRLGIILPNRSWLGYLIFSVVTIIIATASWLLIESPVKRLREAILAPKSADRIPATR